MGLENDDYSGGSEAHLDAIAELLQRPVQRWKVLKGGVDNHTYLIDDFWVFRIACKPEWAYKLAYEHDFLEAFGPVSPVPVPKINHYAPGISGYPYLQGKMMTEGELGISPSWFQKRVGTELGLFLSTLQKQPFTPGPDHDHAFRNMYTRSDFEKTIDHIFTLIVPALSKTAAANFDHYAARLAVAPLFDHRTVTIHRDLYVNNMLFNQSEGVLAAVIDFGELSVGPEVMDVSILADFTRPNNDDLLKATLTALRSPDHRLWEKVKWFAPLEVLFHMSGHFENGSIRPGQEMALFEDLNRAEALFSSDIVLDLPLFS